MPWLTSNKPDITESIPGTLGGATAAKVAIPQGWDVAFDSEGFNLRVDETNLYQRSTERPRKQQIDTSPQAGEQTLGNWWTRSQDTWDLGAGVTWYEPEAQEGTLGRFHESQGINVWTPGELRLLNAMDTVTAAAGADSHLVTFDTALDQGVVEFRGEVARRITAAGVSSATTTGTTNTGFTMPTVSGDSVFVGSTTGVWQYVPSLTTLTLVLTHSTPHSSRVWWVKNRLVIALGATLYSAARSASGALSGQTVLFTHPDPSWRWVGVAEASTAILAAGSSNGESGVYRMNIINDDDGNPQIGPGSQVISMPNGEIIYSMGTYLGTSLVLGTSYGVRVGQMNSDGDASLGVLTIESTTPVVDIAFRDRFAYVPLTTGLPDGGGGAARIDLSSPIGESTRYAWATDVRVPSGTAQTLASIALVGDRVALSNTAGTYLQSATRYESIGYLDTGRIRFATVERKAFCWLRIVSEVGAGRILITAVDPSNNETNIVAMDSSFATDDDISIVVPQRPLDQYLSFRMYLEPGGVGDTDTPVIGGLVIKAQPASSRIRLFQYPLQIADTEKNRVGETRSGGPASGYRRLAQLERLEETGVPIQVFDSRTGERYRGQIDSIDFSTSIPPDKGTLGYAGVALVVVRRLS